MVFKRSESLQNPLMFFSQGSKKRGISAIVATVLIILITVAGVAIIWVAVVPMITEKASFHDPNLRLDIIDSEGYTVYDSDLGLASVQVKRGVDEADLLGFDLIFDIDGESVKHFVNSTQLPAPNEARVYYVNLSNYSAAPSVIRVAPVFTDGEVGNVISEFKMKMREGNLKFLSDGDIANGEVAFVKSNGGYSGGGGGPSPPPSGGSECAFSLARWNKTSAAEGEAVGLIVEGSSCDGKQVDFTIYENDLWPLADELIVSLNATFGQADWAAVYVDDGLLQGNPEYYFVAYLAEKPSVSATSGELEVSQAAAGCGDGAVGGIEACDDGNVSDGDGCSSLCAIEAGYNCSGEPSVCSIISGCSNDPGCSSVGIFCDGNLSYNCSLGVDGCFDRVNGSVCANGCAGGVCVAGSVCGDGNCDAVEDCLSCPGECGECELFVASYYVDNSIADCLSYDPVARTCGGGAYRSFDTIQEGVNVLQPGDTLAVRGGVYRESVTIGVSGTESERITIRNYPGENPVIDGSEVVGGWEKCTGQAECGGNVNWQNIYYAYAPASANSFSANLYQDDSLLYLSQNPDPSSRLFIEDTDSFFTVPSADITTTQLTDSRLGSGGGEKLVGSYILVWIAGNQVVYRKITSYSSIENTITFEALSNTPHVLSGNSYYSLANSISDNILNSEGEYYFNDTVEVNGLYKVYVWPYDSVDLSSSGQITVSLRTGLISFIDTTYLTLEGFKIQKGLGTIVSDTGFIQEVTIKNNEITMNKGNSPSSDQNMILFNSGGADIILENNNVHNNPTKLRGFVFDSALIERVTIRNNVIDSQGGTAILFQRLSNSKIINNSILNVGSIHGNGMTFYVGASNILVANNRVINSNILLTLQASSNISILNNVFDAKGQGSAIASWGTMSGSLTILNNIILNANLNIGLDVASTDTNQIFLKNNIIDGSEGNPNIERSNNIYTGLHWSQRAFYGWSLSDGEVVQEDLASIFVDAGNGDYRLKDGSPAINNGVDVTEDLPEFLNNPFFSDFDFNKDIDGNPRPSGDGWDIGPYEY